MPNYHLPPESHPAPAAVVRASENELSLPEMPSYARSRAFSRTHADAWDAAAFAKTVPHVSNGGESRSVRVLYVNGMNTSRSDAELACRCISASVGVPPDQVRLLYNPPEESTCVGLVKVIGGTISRQIGREVEDACVSALRTEVERIIASDTERLLVFGHSQGSLIFQNATDSVYDELNRTQAGRQRWKEASLRIEGMFYAPVVGHVVPGMDVVGFTRESDVPGRISCCFSRFVALGKNACSWRRYAPIQTIVIPSESAIGDVLSDPLHGHRCLPLLLNNSFHVIYYATASDGNAVPELLAARLAYSIRHGLRSDHTHSEIIELATKEFGRPFSTEFLKRVKVEDGTGWIKQFRIEPDCIERLMDVAQMRRVGQ